MYVRHGCSVSRARGESNKVELIKHARARRGVITLGAEGGWIEVAVEDDGVGYGLYSIGERLAVLGGRFEVQSGSQGSRVAVCLPITAPAPAAAPQDQQAPAASGDGGPSL